MFCEPSILIDFQRFYYVIIYNMVIFCNSLITRILRYTRFTKNHANVMLFKSKTGENGANFTKLNFHNMSTILRLVDHSARVFPLSFVSVL